MQERVTADTQVLFYGIYYNRSTLVDRFYTTHHADPIGDRPGLSYFIANIMTAEAASLIIK